MDALNSSCSRVGVCVMCMGLAAALVLAATPVVKADAWVGEYRGDGMAVEVDRDANAYRGRIERGQDAYPFQGQLRNGRIEGTFTAGAHQFAFSLRRGDDGMVVLSTAGRDFSLERQDTGAGINPFGNGDDVKQASHPFADPPIDDADRPPMRGRRLDHPVGFSITVPEGWQGHADGEMVVLGPRVPAGVDPDVFCTAGLDPTVRTIDNPAIVREVARQIELNAPQFRQQGEPVRQQRGDRPLVRVEFDGMNPDTRQPIRGLLVLFMFDQRQAGFIFAGGSVEAMRRDSDRIDAIIDSFAATGRHRPAPVDSDRLEGTWVRQAARGQSTLRLQRDGRELRGEVVAPTGTSMRVLGTVDRAGRFAGRLEGAGLALHLAIERRGDELHLTVAALDLDTGEIDHARSQRLTYRPGVEDDDRAAPRPDAASPLEGTWQGEEDHSFTIRGNQITLRIDGVDVLEGTVHIDGQRVHLTIDGDTVDATWRLDGPRLTIIDEDGDEEVFQRVD